MKVCREYGRLTVVPKDITFDQDNQGDSDRRDLQLLGGIFARRMPLTLM